MTLKLSQFAVKSVADAYQGSTAEQDHKDDEGLEPAVFHNLVAGFPQPPPGLTQTVGDINITALTVSDTH